MTRATDAILYYVFHILYLGQVSDTLSRLWITYGLAHGLNERETHTHTPSSEKGSEVDPKRVQDAWKTFDESMRESYKAVGFIAGLIAAGIGSLLSIEAYRSNSTAQTFLLAGLTASVLSAAGCISLLSTIFPDPVFIERNWGALGIVFVIFLAGPPAWLYIALWSFQFSLLAIVWLEPRGGGGAEPVVAKGARVLVTFCIVLRLVVKIGANWYSSKLLNSRTEYLLSFLGIGQGMSDYMVNLNENTIEEWRRYLRSLEDGTVYRPPGLTIWHRLFGARMGLPLEEYQPSPEPPSEKPYIQGLRGGAAKPNVQQLQNVGGGRGLDHAHDEPAKLSAEDRLFGLKLQLGRRKILEQDIASSSGDLRPSDKLMGMELARKVRDEDEEGAEGEEEGEGKYVDIDDRESPRGGLGEARVEVEPAQVVDEPPEETLSDTSDVDADDTDRGYSQYAKGEEAV